MLYLVISTRLVLAGINAKQERGEEARRSKFVQFLVRSSQQS